MKSVNTKNHPIVPDAPTVQNLDTALPRINNIIHIVVSKKNIKEEKPKAAAPICRADLIKLTEKLAEDAKTGALKGIGGFAEYENDYMLGLEGSYLMNPESAILPVKRLERRIMDQIIEHED